jgi:hypothetical protein
LRYILHHHFRAVLRFTVAFFFPPKFKYEIAIAVFNRACERTLFGSKKEAKLIEDKSAAFAEKGDAGTSGQSYQTFYGRNWRVFVISYNLGNVCGYGREPTL